MRAALLCGSGQLLLRERRHDPSGIEVGDEAISRAGWNRLSALVAGPGIDERAGSIPAELLSEVIHAI